MSVLQKQVEVLLLRPSEQPVCPTCGSERLERLMSITASPAVRSGRSLPVTGAGEGCGMPRCCGGGCAMD
ncbi:MAG: zinc ribbon domain-containing protein [Pirellulaceae bacterium]